MHRAFSRINIFFNLSLKEDLQVSSQVRKYLSKYVNLHWRQMGLKRGGAEREFETHLLKFETYLVLRDYETEKTTGAPAPASLAPM